jgi:hypothetical protein
MKKLISLLAACLMVVAVAGSASASNGTTATYKGQGLAYDGTTWNVDNELCGTENGAERDGGYLLWVFTATKSATATITGPWGTAEPMEKQSNGTFKYVSDWYSPGSLIDLVTAVAVDNRSKNPQLVISHGCKPYTEDGAWCSPGYWKNAAELAWTRTGYAKTDLFNETVVPNFYDTASAADPTLFTVLDTPGANTFGSASSPYGLNAFNATGAFLTDQIPGYTFDLSLIGVNEACPLDNHGNFKPRS